MSAKANPTRIGVFVTGAIALLTAVVVVFGSGQFLRHSYRYVAYFDGSVAGLVVGAPVTWQGVNIGRVVEVKLRFDRATIAAQIPVYFEVFPDRFEAVGEIEGSPEERMQAMIQAGLRAQLVSQSFVTGQQAIQLNLLPDTEGRLVGGDPETPEVPTVPTQIETIISSLEELRLNELVNSFTDLATNLNALVSDPETKRLVPELVGAVASINALIESVRSDVVPRLVDTEGELIKTLKRLQTLADTATETFEQGTKTLSDLDNDIGPAVADIRALVQDLRTRLPATLDTLEGTLANIEATTAPEGKTVRDLRQALQQFSQAARSVRDLADLLERDPGALLRGK